MIYFSFAIGMFAGVIGARSPDYRLASTRFQKLLLTLRWTFAVVSAESAWFLLTSDGNIGVIVICVVVGAVCSLASVLGFDEAHAGFAPSRN